MENHRSNTDTSNEIKIRFAYTFSDWASAALFCASRTLGNVFQILALLVALGFAGYNFWLSYLVWPFRGLDYHFWWALLFLAIAIEAKFSLVQLLRMWFRQRKNAGKPPKVYEFTFDETGARYQLNTESDNLDVEQAWTQFKKVLECKQAFLLLHKEGGHWTLPKRYFADTEEINALRDLLKRKVGKAAEQPQATQ